MDARRPAGAKDWKAEEFGQLIPVPYKASFNHDELKRLKLGLIPAAMEDKWFVYFDDNILFFHRSWTGIGVFQVHLAVDNHGASVTGAFTSDHFPAARQDVAYSARLLGFLVSNLMLGRDEPFPAR